MTLAPGYSGHHKSFSAGRTAQAHISGPSKSELSSLVSFDCLLSKSCYFRVAASASASEASSKWWKQDYCMK